LSPRNRAESNTNYAQGGIAAVTSKEDSSKCTCATRWPPGAGLVQRRRRPHDRPGRPGAHRRTDRPGHEVHRARDSHGARELDLGREGGHSKRRILHAKDVTGREIERALLAAVAEQPNIRSSRTTSPLT
jgi:L-aspartate oxidase